MIGVGSFLFVFVFCFFLQCSRLGVDSEGSLRGGRSVVNVVRLLACLVFVDER